MHRLFTLREHDHGAYPFDQVEVADFRPAFAEAIAEKRSEVEAIIQQTDAPTFANTIVALERSGAKLEWLSGIFYNLLHAEATDELMEISQELSPELSALSSYILLSEGLFARIRSVWEERDQLKLDLEDARLLQRTYESFSESGALLPEDKKERLREVKRQLSELALTFGQNNLKEQARFRLWVEDDAQVAGLPESALGVARELAKKEDKPHGYLFTLAAPSFFPFMQHCPDSNLREEMYRAKMSLGAVDGEFDNRDVIRRLANLRLELAQLLGHTTFASKVLTKRMAGSPEAVYRLLDELLEAYLPVAKEELAKVEAFAREAGETKALQPWDWSYWAEQYKKAFYKLDEEELRPYFELNRVSTAIFSLATRLYGIHFSERTDLPVYHPDVHTYEVQDRDGSYLGLLYTDFFPREGKQSGAWMNNLQEQYHTA